MKKLKFLLVCMGLMSMIASCTEYIPSDLNDEVRYIVKKSLFGKDKWGIAECYYTGNKVIRVEPAYDTIYTVKEPAGFIAVLDHAKTFYSLQGLHSEEGKIDNFSHITRERNAFRAQLRGGWVKYSGDGTIPHYTIHTTGGMKYALLSSDVHKYYKNYDRCIMTGPFEDYYYIDWLHLAYKKDGLWGVVGREYDWAAGGLARLSLEECKHLLSPKYKKIFLIEYRRYNKDYTSYRFVDSNLLYFVQDSSGNWKTLDMSEREVPEELQLTEDVLNAQLSSTEMRNRHAEPWKRGVYYADIKACSANMGYMCIDHAPMYNIAKKKSNVYWNL